MLGFPSFSGGSSGRPSLIFNFSIFRKNKSAIELFNTIFDNSSPKGFLGWNKKKSKILVLSEDSSYLQAVALKRSTFTWVNTVCPTVMCKSNESVIRRNSRFSRLFNEKCRIIIHLESLKKIQQIFPLPIVLVNMNF